MLASVLARLRSETGQFWLHLVGVVLEASSPREEVVRALVRFLEAATVADFPARVESESEERSWEGVWLPATTRQEGGEVEGHSRPEACRHRG